VRVQQLNGIVRDHIA